MGLIARVPTGYYDITDYLTNAADYNGTNDVTTALNDRIDYCRQNDLTLLLPRNTVFMVTDVVKGIQPTSDPNGKHTSPGTLSLVGQQGGTPPRIFLGDGATANGYNRTATLGLDVNTKPLIHFLKGDQNTAGWTYGYSQEDTSQFYASTIQGVTLDGNGFHNCSVVCFDSAQDCVFSDCKIIATGCYAGLVGWPGRGVFSRNIEIIGGKFGVYQRRPYTTFNSSSGTGLGGGFANLKITGATDYGLYVDAARGALAIAGLRLQMSSGIGIYTYSPGNIEIGNLVLWDSIVEMGASGTGILVDGGTVGIFNSYFGNCAKIVDESAAGETDYAGASSGWFYVSRYVTNPAEVGPAGTTNATYVDGAAITSPVADAANGAVAAQDESIVAQHYFREADFTNPDQVIWATDGPSTADIAWRTTSAPCVPLASGVYTTDNKPLIAAKIAEADAAGKALFFPRGAASGQGYYPVGGTITLGARSKIIGGVNKRITLCANTAWQSAQTSSGVSAPILDTADDPNADGYVCYLVVPTMFYTARRITLLRYRWGKGTFAHVWGSNQASGRLDYPNIDVLITGSAGGRIISLRNGGSLTAGGSDFAAADQTARKWTLVQNTTLPLTIYGNDPEFGGAPQRTPTHPPLCVFDNAKNVRVFGSKAESQQETYSFINGSSVIMGPCAAIYSNTVAAGPLFSIDATSSVELIAASKSGTGDNTTVSIATELSGVTPAMPLVTRNRSLGYYRRKTAMSTTLWRPAPTTSSDSIAAAVYRLVFEGEDPTTTGFGIDFISLHEDIGGADISTQATITADASGTNVANLNDAADATDFSATGSTAVKVAFGASKILKEVRIKGSSTLSRPTAVTIWYTHPTTGKMRVLHRVAWGTFAAGEVKVVPLNRRGRMVSSVKRGRVKAAAV